MLQTISPIKDYCSCIEASGKWLVATILRFANNNNLYFHLMCSSYRIHYPVFSDCNLTVHPGINVSSMYVYLNSFTVRTIFIQRYPLLSVGNSNFMFVYRFQSLSNNLLMDRSLRSHRSLI